MKKTTGEKILVGLVIIGCVFMFIGMCSSAHGQSLNPTYQSVKLDSLIQRGSAMYISNGTGSNAYLRTAGDSLYMGDVTGEKYLGSAAAGVTPTNDIFEWYAVGSYYRPYSAFNANSWYYGTTDPTGTTRLNYDGIITPESIQIYAGDYYSDLDPYGVSFYNNIVYENLVVKSYGLTLTRSSTIYFQAFPNTAGTNYTFGSVTDKGAGSSIVDINESDVNKYQFFPDSLEASTITATFKKTVQDTAIIGGDTLIGSVSLKTAVEAQAFDKINFDTACELYEEGKLIYCKENRALTFYNDITDFSHQLGYEHVVRFYNASGGTLTNGTVIRSTGARVNSEITFTAGIAGIGSIDSLQGIAMVTADVLAGNYGIATLMGQVNGLNTSAYSDNDIIYANFAGTITIVSPVPPYYSVPIGRVMYADADSGAIYIYPIRPAEYVPTPSASISFTKETQIINNSVINNFYLITDGSGTLYSTDYNSGFTVAGDTLTALVGGVYSITASYAFQGDATNTDDWRVGLFINGAEEFSVLRTSSSSNKGVIAFSKILTISAGDGISARIANTTNGTRDAIFTDGAINLEYIGAN